MNKILEKEKKWETFSSTSIKNIKKLMSKSK